MASKRSNLLDIIKGLMIVFIIITHFGFSYPDDYRKFGFFYWIDMAVPVFMIITGYLAAQTMEGYDTISQAYFPSTIITKALRFIVPWLPCVLVEIYLHTGTINCGLKEIIKIYTLGGLGPGSYYTPIMMQMILIGPVIYYIIKRLDINGFIFCFIVTGCWEALSYCIRVDNIVYSLLAIRYISQFAFGSFIAIGKRKLNCVELAIMFIVGLVWQTLLNYVPLQPPFMNNAWARVNLYSTLFVLPVMYIVIKKYSDKNINIPILCEFGKASFNIYLVQMVFYGSGQVQIVYKLASNKVMQLIICVVLCTLFGYIYYRIENPIRKKLNRAIHNYFDRKSITVDS